MSQSHTNETFSYSPEANLLVSVDGAEPVLYNNGDMAWILVAGVLGALSNDCQDLPHPKLTESQS